MKNILSQSQFCNLLELFKNTNSGGRCWDCGCPDNLQIIKGVHFYGSSAHFQKCKQIRLLKKEIKDNETDAKKSSSFSIKDFDRNFRVIKGRIQFKDIVIDEVYECRWDCYIKSGRA